MWCVDDVLIYLIGDHKRIVFPGQTCNEFQLLPVNTLPQGLEGLHSTRVLGCWRKASSSTSGSKAVVRWHQGYIDWLCA